MILAIMLGPVGSVGALSSLDTACSVGCPCDDDTESADPCDDDEVGHQEVEHDDPEPESADDCGDDCSECDCEAGITAGVAAASVDFTRARIAAPRGAYAHASLLPAAGGEIFIPPRH
jgi:hypothetical protein